MTLGLTLYKVLRAVFRLVNTDRSTINQDRLTLSCHALELIELISILKVMENIRVRLRLPQISQLHTKSSEHILEPLQERGTVFTITDWQRRGNCIMTSSYTTLS